MIFSTSTLLNTGNLVDKRTVGELGRILPAARS